MTQLTEAFPDFFFRFHFQNSVLHSFIEDIESVYKANSVVGLLATNLYFLFATHPAFKYGKYDKGDCYKLLARLCELSCPNRR